MAVFDKNSFMKTCSKPDLTHRFATSAIDGRAELKRVGKRHRVRMAVTVGLLSRSGCGITMQGEHT